MKRLSNAEKEEDGGAKLISRSVAICYELSVKV
jgi:hypothetical protein